MALFASDQEDFEPVMTKLVDRVKEGISKLGTEKQRLQRDPSSAEEEISNLKQKLDNPMGPFAKKEKIDQDEYLLLLTEKDQIISDLRWKLAQVSRSTFFKIVNRVQFFARQKCNFSLSFRQMRKFRR